MSATARLRVCRGNFSLDVDLAVAQGETLVLAGPSGAGKTSVVRLMAGVDALAEGRVALDATVWDDPASGVFVPPHRRDVGWLPQGTHLFPHLDALENVAFGMRRRGWEGRRAGQEAAEWLDRLGLGARHRARLPELSGGEQQRVALARALAPRPRLVLLDEPFAGLDVVTRISLRRVLREALAHTSAARVVVAHEPFDALAAADRVVILESGRVSQEGTPQALSSRPRTAYVAEFTGLNLVEGTARPVSGRTVLDVSGGGRLELARALSGPAVATFRPSAVALYRTPPSGSPRNVIEGVITEMSTWGERARVRLDSRPPVVAELTAAAVADLGIRVGDHVHAVVKATEIEVTPA